MPTPHRGRFPVGCIVQSAALQEDQGYYIGSNYRVIKVTRNRRAIERGLFAPDPARVITLFPTHSIFRSGNSYRIVTGFCPVLVKKQMPEDMWVGWEESILDNSTHL